jgi:hypothetical protein
MHALPHRNSHNEGRESILGPPPTGDRAILEPIAKGGKPLMSVEVHVTGRVQLGRFAEFADAAERWRDFRAGRGHAPCRILHALSGEMNAVRLVFAYPDLNAYEQEEARDAADPDYARVAGAMPFVEGTLAYEIYREAEPE